MEKGPISIFPQTFRQNNISIQNTMTYKDVKNQHSIYTYTMKFFLAI